MGKVDGEDGGVEGWELKARLEKTSKRVVIYLRLLIPASCILYKYLEASDTTKGQNDSTQAGERTKLQYARSLGGIWSTNTHATRLKLPGLHSRARMDHTTKRKHAVQITPSLPPQPKRAPIFIAHAPSPPTSSNPHRAQYVSASFRNRFIESSLIIRCLTAFENLDSAISKHSSASARFGIHFGFRRDSRFTNELYLASGPSDADSVRHSPEPQRRGISSAAILC